MCGTSEALELRELREKRREPLSRARAPQCYTPKRCLLQRGALVRRKRVTDRRKQVSQAGCVCVCDRSSSRELERERRLRAVSHTEVHRPVRCGARATGRFRLRGSMNPIGLRIGQNVVCVCAAEQPAS